MSYWIGFLLLILACNPKAESPFVLQKVLVIGNSITYHPPEPQIGWNAAWGMAASTPEKDFFSLLHSQIKNRHADVEMIRENVFPFERQFQDFSFVQYRALRDFDADLLIIRLGENVDTDKLEGWNFSRSLQQFTDSLLQKPDAQVLITTTFWENEKINEQLRHAAGERGWPTVALDHLGREDRYMALGEYDNQSVARHPNDLGMATIAELIFQAISAMYNLPQGAK
ncbi:MAG: SGNH/GDSL hydrolase family protein, partial [Cyclobacteriaceae bacterium]